MTISWIFRIVEYHFSYWRYYYFSLRVGNKPFLYYPDWVNILQYLAAYDGLATKKMSNNVSNIFFIMTYAFKELIHAGMVD